MYEVQEPNKPTRRQYLPLMEVAHKEDPDDGQICFWLGRDYMWANQHDRAIELLLRYLALPIEHLARGTVRGDALSVADATRQQDVLAG